MCSVSTKTDILKPTRHNLLLARSKVKVKVEQTVKFT